jgi:hypothetical protein
MSIKICTSGDYRRIGKDAAEGKAVMASILSALPMAFPAQRRYNHSQRCCCMAGKTKIDEEKGRMAKEKPEEPIEKQLWKSADKLRKNIDAARRVQAYRPWVGVSEIHL